MYYSELKKKCVVTTSGKKIGYVVDVIINDNTAMLDSIIVAMVSNNKWYKFFLFPIEKNIKLSSITMIGEDIIMVKY